MKSPLLVGFGVVIGIIAGAGACFLIMTAVHRPPDYVPDWRDVALGNTMPGRRAYTLPLNNPDMIPADQADYMKDDDVVLGALLHGEARAYPWWLVSNYHVVNDTVGEHPLLIALCEVCGGASAFRPQLADLPGIDLSFQICGVSLGTLEIIDHQTQSKWRPFLGTAFDGPLKGTSLERYPLLTMRWKEWRQRYPASLVANGSPQLRLRPHGAEAGGVIGDSDLPTLFAGTANLTDSRLARHELVLGILIRETGQAYAVPVALLTPFPNLFQVGLGQKQILVVRDGEFAITAYEIDPQVQGSGFSLVSTNPAVFRSPDGWTWNVFGIGTLPGNPDRKLPSATSYLTEWYEWVSHSPKSEIVTSVKTLGSGRPIESQDR